MALPRILLGDDKIVLLSGFEKANSSGAVSPLIIDAEDAPNYAEQNPDTVAFSSVPGEWWPE
jgi:hypothetical protein